MATLRQRLRIQASDGTYNTVHLETTADHVLMPDGTTLNAKLLALRETINSLGTTLGTTHNLGDIFVWAGYTWQTVHNTDDCEYAILFRVSEYTAFSFNNVYAGSILATKCEEFLATISQEDQEKLMDVTVNGVTSKVFVPTKEQCEGEFSWFVEKEHRIARTSPYPSELKTWWTSSPGTDGNAWWVSNSGGNIGQGSVTNDNYVFRPCIALKR